MSDALHFYPNIWPEHSAYAKRWLTRFPEWDSEESSQEHLLSCIQRWIKQVKPLKSEEQIMSGLRRMRQRCMIEVMKRDLLGKAELFDITEALSFLADSSVQIALEFAHAQQAAKFGNPSNGDCLIVVGMGKLGGLELNVSSDIDLIFLYGTEDETEGGPTGRKQSHAEFFTQVGRKIIKMLSEVTDEGFVFRVDMRLRPNGDSGPLVSSLDMLEEYFLVQGREWERYAWIKSRVINWAIDPTQDDAFQNNLDTLNSIVRPFVYRKYLDFGAIRALRNLHVQIRNEVNKRELHHPGSIHVKLGRGGIREIEFIAQAFQLIRGGRQPQLQLRRTVDALAICAEQDLMTPSELDKIQAAYYFLRNLEHRLQYIDDAQTHRLPADPTQVLKIARSMGFEDPSIFMKALKSHMEFVSNHFDQVFGDKQEDEETTDLSAPWGPELTQGFNDPQGAQERYYRLIESNRYKTLPTAHRERVDRLMPSLLSEAGSSESPDACWRSCCELIETICRRGAYLSLLDEFPAARMRVSRILAASHWAANFLIRHPILLDELLDARTLLAEPDFDTWGDQVEQSLALSYLPDGTPDLERQMDIVREQHHAQLFRILAQDLEDLHTVERISDLLSALADKTLEIVLRQAWLTVPKRHTDTPKFAIIAYGKHGGKELGYSSDLDMIFLFDDDDQRAPEVYARLAQRISRWLSTQTGAGQLFDTDYRLRPNGEAGLMVSSVKAYENYQRREGGIGAWFWEHQALTRARFCVGDEKIGKQFDALREEILRLPRKWEDVQVEVVTMRKKMLEGHPNHSDLFDVKHDRGGMVDVEFMVQALVLGYAHKHPELCANVGNIALLNIVGDLGLVDQELATHTADVYRKLRAKQHAMRLAGNEKSRTSDPSILVQTNIVLKMWDALFGGVEPATTE